MTGREITEIREGYGMTPAQFAAALGVTQSSVYRWETLGNKTVNLEQMQTAMLLKAREQLGVRKPAAARSIGEEIGQALLIGGALFAAYKFMEALFSKK